jgi:hypothetical protein
MQGTICNRGVSCEPSRPLGIGVIGEHARLRKAVAAAAAGLSLLGGPAAAQSEPAQTDPAARRDKYEFTTILNSKRDRLEPTRCAALNTQGTVAVQVRDPSLGINKLITKRTAADGPVVILDTRSVAHSPTFCDNGITLIPSDPTINELGEVAVQGNLRRLTTDARCGTTEQRARRQGVFLGSGGPLTTIAHTINPPGGDFISEFLVADQTVNDSGKVAFIPELDLTFDSGLFVGSKQGTFETRFLVSDGRFSGISSRVSLNESGQIAFQSTQRETSTQGIFLSNPDGSFTTIADDTGEIGSFDAPSLNNSATVAFLGSKFVDDVQVLGIFTSSGGPVTTVVDSTGPFDSFREPSLNDLGKVAFTADLDELGPDGRQVQGVFTGPDPSRDVVLQAGDKYDGARVTSITTCSEALNNKGEIVMTVQSEDPTTFEVLTFIVKATPRG